MPYPRRDSNPHCSAFKAPASAIGLRGPGIRLDGGTGGEPAIGVVPGAGRLGAPRSPATAVARPPTAVRRPHCHSARADSTPAASSNSWNGLAIDPSETISRWKNSARVQSATTRTLRLKVGTRDRW